MQQGKWRRVAVFYLIALAVAALARLYWHTSDIASSLRSPWIMYLHLVSGLGPALGAVAVCVLFRYRSRMSLGGTDLPLALVTIAVPAAVLGVIGVANPFAIEPHLFGVHLGIWIALYAVLEEIGWRGYLQDEFANRPALLRYAIVGLFWYAWHLSWLHAHAIGDELFTILFMILASIGIGFVADRTRSVLAAAGFHVIGNIMGLTTDFKTLIPSAQSRILIVIACVALWLVILRIWRMRDVRLGRLAAPAGG